MKIVWSFVVIVGSVVLGLLLRPDVYRASGRLMITGQRVYFRLAPSPGELRQPPPEPSIQDINTEIENIKSAAFLNKIIASLPFSVLEDENNAATNQEEQGALARGLSVISSSLKAITAAPGKLKKMLISLTAANDDAVENSGNTLDGVQRPNPALAILRTGLEVTMIPNSELVEVAFSDENPKRATAIVNAILEAYPIHQASLYQNPLALAFYDKQKERLEPEIAMLENQLKEFETNENLVGLSAQKDQVLDLLEKTKDRLKGTDLDIEQNLGKIARLEKELLTEPATIVQSQDRVDPSTKLLEERLTTLEIEKNELLQKYTEKDRRVQDKISEIEFIREKIASAPRGQIIVSERLAPNPVRMDMLKELAEQKVKLGQLYPKRETLIRQVGELHDELERLNTKGYEVQHLQEAIASKKESYALYSKKAEEARISGAMDQENLVNVKITDRALVPMAPVGGNAAILLLLAAIVGIGSGVGGVLTLEYIRPTFHSEIDVERQLQLPVLALIPDLREEA
jgi:uncharacterized protein involved in exopolysaccharide biosynthesis